MVHFYCHGNIDPAVRHARHGVRAGEFAAGGLLWVAWLLWLLWLI
jgi:hypothetical protein